MRISPRAGVVLLALAVAVLLTGLIGYDIWREHGAVIAQAGVRTGNLNRVLEENTRQSLRRVELSLVNAEKLLLRDGAQALAGQPASPALRRSLTNLLPSDGLIQRIVLFNPDGVAVLSTGAESLPPTQAIGTMPVFTVHRDAAAPAIAISPVIRTPYDGKLRFLVSHRVTLPDGSFGGVLMSGIEPSYFQRFYDSINSGRGGFVSVFLERGYILARSPYDEKMLLRSWLEAPLFREHLPRAATGTVRQVVATDGVERIYSYRHMKDYPVIVTLGESLTESLVPWRENTQRELFVLLLVLQLLAVATYFLLRQLGQRAAAQAELAALNRDLEARVGERTAALTRSNRDLQAAVAELESFSYSISHDLRAPLRAIGGFARLVAEDEAARLSDEARRKLGVIEHNANRMGLLIDGLLMVTRINRAEVEHEEVDLGALARALARDHALQHPRTHVVIDPVPPAWGDATLLRQALFELLGNAFKYSAPAGTPQVEFSWDAAKRAWLVRDNGVGFDMLYTDRIFEVFHRLHHADEFPGTGIGLAIVERVILRHGGQVWAEASPGQGTVVYFSLPEAAAPMATAATAAPA